MGGSLTSDEVVPYLLKYPELTTFIETGTFKGFTTRMAATQFEHVYTFELHPVLHKEAVSLAENHNFDTSGYLLGDSTILLKDLLISGVGPSFLYIDSHQSGPDTTNNGIEHVPLITELKIINELYSKGQKAVVCVDDYRLFGRYLDWAHISTQKIKDVFTNHIITHECVENDRYWLVLN